MRRRAKKRHSQSEQAAHKLWVLQQKYSHTYGKETPKSSRKRKPGRDKIIDVPNDSRKKFKVDVTDSNIGIDRTGLLAIPILFHEHNMWSAKVDKNRKTE